MLNLFISCKPRDNCSPLNSLYKVRGGYRQKAVIYQIKQVQVESVYSPPFSQHLTFVTIYDDDLLVMVANNVLHISSIKTVICKFMPVE